MSQFIMPSESLQVAQSLHKVFPYVIPMQHKSKDPSFFYADGRRFDWGDFYDSTIPVEMLAEFTWEGYAGVSGPGDIRCIDLDHCLDLRGNLTDEPVKDLLADLGLPLDYRYVAKSGSGEGWHVWFRCKGDLEKNRIARKGPHGSSFKLAELRWNHVYTILAPSLHKDTGLPYEWVHGMPTEPPPYIDFKVVMQAYDFLTGHFNIKPLSEIDSGIPAEADGYEDCERSDKPSKEFGRNFLKKRVAEVLDAEPGTKHDTLYKLACRVGRHVAGGSIDADEAFQALSQASIDSGHDRRDATRTTRDGIAMGMKHPLMPPKDKREETKPVIAEAPRTKLKFKTADSLAEEKIPAMKWIVPDLIPEGLTLFSGASKMGKSWMVLGIALAVASGGKVLGDRQVEQGSVLYLSLEDTFLRLQTRQHKILQGKPAPNKLYLAIESNLQDQGGLEDVEEWVKNTPDARMVIIDIYERFRPAAKGNIGAYQRDYQDLSPLQALAKRHNIAVLVVHHTKKEETADVFNQATGSSGMQGATDAMMVLKRPRNSYNGTLDVTGRDTEEQTLAVNFSQETGSWVIQGDAYEVKLSQERQNVLAALKEHGELGPKELAAVLPGKSEGSVKMLLKSMVDDRQINQPARGKYAFIQSFEDEQVDGAEYTAPDGPKQRW